jgi:hypothetical protein
MTAVAALAVMSLVGACGGDDSDDDSSDTDNAEADAALEYAECMRDNGLEDWPDPIEEDGGVNLDSGERYDMDMPEVQTAHEACVSIVEAVEDAAPEMTPEELAKMRDDALAVGECMRENGYEDFPDPEVSDDGSGAGIAIGPDSDIPEPGDPGFEEFEATHFECDPELEADMEEADSDGEGGTNGEEE